MFAFSEDDVEYLAIYFPIIIITITKKKIIMLNAVTVKNMHYHMCNSGVGLYKEKKNHFGNLVFKNKNIVL